MEVLQRTANRGSISTGEYEIDNSCKFEADNSEQLYRTPSSDGNMKTWTYSVWFKRTELGTGMTLISALDTYMYFETDDTAWLNIRSASTNFFMATNRKFRDTSAWYHAVIVCDLTDGTAADRLKLYINGVRETSFSNNTYENADSDDNTGMHKATVHRIGQYSGYGNKFCGYMAEINSIDGQALAPTEFGEFDENSGIWKPKEYTGSYGTNGFYLDFADAADLGDDESGNGNDWTEGGITSADQATDTPTNNFCTLSPLWVYGNALTTGPIEGATKVSGGAWAGTKATMGVANGKWYWEYKSSVSDAIIGIQTDEGVALTGNAHNIISTCALYLAGEVWIKDSTSGRNDTDVTHTFSSSSVYGIALNMDDNQISFYQDGSLITNGGNIALDGLADKTVFPFASNYNSTIEFNLGGYTTISISSAASDANGYGTFEYAPPSGYYALCGKNLAEFGGSA